jgi:hypothetical protein
MAYSEKAKEIIFRFANGDESLRSEVMRINRHYRPLIGGDGSPESHFLAVAAQPNPNAADLAYCRR